jgi:LEA14-like dessication related protein
LQPVLAPQVTAHQNRLLRRIATRRAKDTVPRVNSIAQRCCCGVLGLFLAGCSALDREPPLDLMLVNVLPGEGGGLGDAPLMFVVRLENTSPEPVTVDGGSYKIYLGGTYVGQGLSNERIDLARLSSGTVNVTVHLSTLRLAGSLYHVLRSHQVSYQLQGTVYTLTGGGSSQKYHISREGTVNLDQVQNTFSK